MTQEQDRIETVDLLQDLGLKEYEARCFLALTQVSAATAKEISDRSEVPRTRVYDAVRVLEAEGLVEVQHSSPQQFRAVSIDEAVSTLRRKYEDRLDNLETYLQTIDSPRDAEGFDQMQEVWSLTGHAGIQTRTMDLIDDAESELMILVVDESILEPSFYERIEAAMDRDVDVLVGVISSDHVGTIQDAIPDAQVFETGLDWLVAPADGEVAISRILLEDRESVLVSSFYPHETDEAHVERAIFAAGISNGLVVLIRRLISTGLLQEQQISD